MAGNSYGTLFKLTTFGESHGEALGGIIDGCPSGIELDLNAIQNEMQRRKPGQSSIVTQRKEEDEVQLLSGIFEGGRVLFLSIRLQTYGPPCSLPLSDSYKRRS